MVQGPRPRREHAPSPSSPRALLVLTRLRPSRANHPLRCASPPARTSQFRILAPEELPAGQACGVGFKTVSVCPTYYLPWLKTELAARGVTFIRKKVTSLGEATALAGPGGVLVNATGLGAS